MGKIREIHNGVYRVTPVEVPATGGDLSAWLAAQATAYALTTLLAHADDGVIWGRVENATLLTSGAVFAEVSPPLRWTTLQQARLFGPSSELLLWRADDGWQARLVQDGQGDPVEFYDELQMLWGIRLVSQEDGFALVTDGAQRHRHAPPIALTPAAFKGDNHRPLRLQVRNYLTVGEDGLLRVALSRLVRLTTEAETKEV